jgi:protein TonB
LIRNLFIYLTGQDSDIDDLLFRQRNKDYGAFLLRRRYARNMSIALAIAIFIFLFCLIMPSVNWNKEPLLYDMTEVILDAPPEFEMPKFKSKPTKATDQNIKDEIKIKKPQSTESQFKVVKEREVEPVKSKVEQSSDISQNDSSSATIQSDSIQGNKDSDGDSDLPFDFAEVMPQFPGGQGSLKRFIASKSVYPGSALQNKIEGTVIVGFIIDKYGRLRSPKILKSLYPACDEEALRVVRLIPDWIPAKNQGRDVSINFSMPIEFKLKR